MFNNSYFKLLKGYNNYVVVLVVIFNKYNVQIRVHLIIQRIEMYRYLLNKIKDT